MLLVKGNDPPSQRAAIAKKLCAKLSILNQWRSEGMGIGDSCPGRPRHRRAPGYLGEFLNAPVTNNTIICISVMVNFKPMATMESYLETLYWESNEDTFDPRRLPLGVHL